MKVVEIFAFVAEQDLAFVLQTLEVVRGQFDILFDHFQLKSALELELFAALPEIVRPAAMSWLVGLAHFDLIIFNGVNKDNKRE